MISMVIPTYNESANIKTLVDAVSQSLEAAGLNDYEVLIMDDDSPDHTAQLVNDWHNPKVRAVNRRGKQRGLSAAVIDGFQEARGEWLGVMDADLSHPPSVLPKLAGALKDGAHLAIGSRYIAGGGIKNWPLKRRITSIVACFLAIPFTRVRDATSGFFMLKKHILDGVKLNALGFKIGLEVCVKAKHAGNWKEVPYTFTDRAKGESKLAPGVMLAYLKQLASFIFSK